MATPATLRSAFQEKLALNDDPDFNQQDLERINDDRYLLRVLKHSDYDLSQASDMLFEIFSWRKSVNASDINESNIRMDYVEEGIIFPHGRDVDQCLLLIIECKKHIKGQKDFDEIKRAIIYWFDRIEREENGKKITLFFDLENCGLSNMDMDVINYLILLLKSYYPYFLNFIIIYQMPCAMSAAFKLIKSLLPAWGVHKLKFVNRETLKDFVNPDQALTCWGGLDDYVFEFVPESKTDNASKKLAFAEHSHTSQHPVGELLQLTPDDMIYFKAEKDDISGKLTISNMNESAVSYKIVPIAPEKFRVRPNFGVLASGASQTIVVTVKQQKTSVNLQTTAKDIFVILAMQIPKTDMSQKELIALWRSKANTKVQYRLKCHFSEHPKPRNFNCEDEDDELESVNELLEIVEEKHTTLKISLDDMKHLQYILILLTTAAVIIGILTHFVRLRCEKFCNDLFGSAVLAEVRSPKPFDITKSFGFMTLNNHVALLILNLGLYAALLWTEDKTDH